MVFNKIKYVIVTVVMLTGFSGFSQKEIKNRIVDLMTQDPIESASIYIQNTTIGTISNADGRFSLRIPPEHQSDTLVISSIGYKSLKTAIGDFDAAIDIYMESDIASLDEVVLVAEQRPKTGNEIVLKALSRLPENLPETPYLQKGFLRHKERNKKEFKWLIESAVTLYDSGFQSSSAKNLKVNVDQVRKSYDLRDVDSLLAYTSYLKQFARTRNLDQKNLRRDTIATSSLVKAIKWNDTRVNGLQNLFEGKLNLLRNSEGSRALFGERILDRHQFELDTVLVDNERKLYKIKIKEGKSYVNLETKGIYNDGYIANGWIYIYWDNYAIKKIEYELIAASDAQKSRSKTLFDSKINHKLILSYMEYEDKMYPNYVYYETPKLVSVGQKITDLASKEAAANYDKDQRYYYTVQELLFTQIILDPETVEQTLRKPWDADIFSQKPYNKTFWDNYNTLLESEEDEKLIQDLTRRSSLYKE